MGHCVFCLGSLGTVAERRRRVLVLKILLAVQREVGTNQPEEGHSDDLRGHGVRGEIELYGSAYVCMANS